MSTPDRFPGPREEEELKLLPASSDPVQVGAFRLVSGAVRIRDNLGVFDPRQGGTGMTPGDHRVLLQLVHFIDNGPAGGFTSGAYEVTTGGLFPTKREWFRHDDTLLLEKIITRSGGAATKIKPTPIVWNLYDTDGTTILETVSDVVTYSGVTETGRVRTIS